MTARDTRPLRSNADCERLASASKDGVVIVWNTRTGRPEFQLSVRGCVGGGQEEWGAAVQSRSLRLPHALIRRSTGSATLLVIYCSLAPPQGHTDSVECVIWSGERVIYTASRDRTIKVWSAQPDNEVRAPRGSRARGARWSVN